MPASPRLSDVAKFYWDRTPHEERAQLVQAVAFAAAQGRPIRVGTACSGTDSPVAVLKALAATVPGLEVQHTFSCEKDAAKRQWILDNFPELPRLFGDIADLGTGQAWDYVAGAVSPVPQVDVFVAGFVCKSISQQNLKREQFADCIREASGLTGVTFKGVLDYVKASKPSVVVLENVRGITTRSKGREPVITHIREKFDESGYAFDYKVLDTRAYLLPHRRTRCWMWAFRGRENQAAALCARERLNGLATKRFWQLKSLFRKVGASPDKHTQTLTARQRQVVRAAQAQAPHAKRLVVDVGQSEARLVFCSGGASPCVLPNSKLYCTSTEKVLGVAQMLAVQGIFRDDFHALPAWVMSRRTLARDMAGNAFSTTPCMAVVLAALIHGPLPRTGGMPSIADQRRPDGSPVAKRARGEA